MTGNPLVYLAARYSRREELCEYRSELERAGYTITSRWLNGSHQILPNGEPLGRDQEALIESGAAPSDVRGQFAAEDWADLLAADTVISFTEPPRSKASRGGRHVEFGAALALNKRCIVVGHRENVFHCLERVEYFETWDEVLDALVASSPW